MTRTETLKFNGPDGDFFTHLRRALRSVGLPGEERFGVGVYVVAASRFLRNPLRLSVQEETEGSATYVVRRVANLLPPGSFIELRTDTDQEWKRFKENATLTTVYLPEGDGRWSEDGGRRFEVASDRIVQVVPFRRDGRVVEGSEEVEKACACISADHRFEPRYVPGWLTMRLQKPPEHAEKHASTLSKKELAQWHDVQRILEERAELGIVFPEWTELVAEYACHDYRAARHLPAFLQLWKAMCLLRSLQSDERSTVRRGSLQATFEDLAAAGLLARKLFREGSRFPSTKMVFERLGPSRGDTSLLHPVTGKGIAYRHRLKKTAQWKSVLE